MALRTIKIKEYNRDFHEDTLRIQRVLIDRGFYAENTQCRRLWELHSEEYAAGWLALPKSDDELYECIHPFFEPGL